MSREWPAWLALLTVGFCALAFALTWMAGWQAGHRAGFRAATAEIMRTSGISAYMAAARRGPRDRFRRPAVVLPAQRADDDTWQIPRT